MPDTEASPFLPITAANVQIGMYVKLDCPWFKHPFPRNTFKVQTAAELTVLRSLEHIPLYVDPSRSDHHPVQTPRAAYVLTSVEARLAPEATSDEEKTAESLIAKKEEAVQAFLRCQESLKTAQARHAEALRQTKDLIDQVFTSREGCAANTLHMIERVTTALDETGRAMAVLNVNNSDDFGPANYASLHALNVFMVAMMMGREFGLSKADMLSLGTGALLHDIGERKVPSQVLAKQRKGEGLTRAEKIFFELHPEYGHRIIEGIGGFRQPPRRSFINIMNEVMDRDRTWTEGRHYSHDREDRHGGGCVRPPDQHRWIQQTPQSHGSLCPPLPENVRPFLNM